MERSKDLCCKFNTFGYLPSKNSFLGLFCTNIRKMFFFAEVLSVHISGICSFKSGGKAPESKSYRETSYFLGFWGTLATDPVNEGWVCALLTMPTRKKSGIKTIKKEKRNEALQMPRNDTKELCFHWRQHLPLLEREFLVITLRWPRRCFHHH